MHLDPLYERHRHPGGHVSGADHDSSIMRSQPGFAQALISARFREAHMTQQALVTLDRLDHERLPAIYSPGDVVAGPWPSPQKTAAADQTIVPQATAISFGCFHVLPSQRLLLEGDRPLRLGSRAFDILVALVERPGRLVSKDELRNLVWPDTFVEAGNLKVQVATLRRTLRDGEDGHRYISTVAGRGYWFVAPVVWSKDISSAPG
jgi:DNA-binding winged helix-turn-helix (wHTH) protein